MAALCKELLPQHHQLAVATCEILRSTSAAEVVDKVDRYGMAVMSIFPGDEMDNLKHTCEVASFFKYRQNGPGRLNLNCVELASTPAFQDIMKNEKLVDVIDRIYKSCGAEKWWWHKSGCGCDVALPHCDSVQNLHSDWSAYPTNSMLGGYALCVGVACQDITEQNGAPRYYTWDVMSTTPYVEESDWSEAPRMTLRKGDVVFRDCRMAHGGCPNVTDGARYFVQMQTRTQQHQRVGKW